jgi:hypothetical protein
MIGVIFWNVLGALIAEKWPTSKLAGYCAYRAWRSICRSMCPDEDRTVSFKEFKQASGVR